MVEKEYCQVCRSITEWDKILLSQDGNKSSYNIVCKPCGRTVHLDVYDINLMGDVPPAPEGFWDDAQIE